ncbi:MAG: putative Fibronectin, type precursor [Acidobacteria bacterium]|jgi:hypothetical protein|nr:putative Fibronectin, type precursor [Acidobacteriota bacterium]
MRPRLLSRLACLLFPILLGLAACAKTGAPEPPQVLIPKAALDLALRQQGTKILLTVSIPVENTNGTPAPVPDRAEAFRLAAAGRSDAGPLPEADFLARAQPIRSLTARELENIMAGGRLHLVDQPDPKDPVAMYAQGYRYAVRFMNRKNQTAGLSNQAWIAPVAIPDAPAGLSAELFVDSVRLHWEAPQENSDGTAPARIAGYNIYRQEESSGFPTAPLNPEPVSGTFFDDRNFELDKTYYYAVSVVGSRENPNAESLPSVPIPVTPRDTFPPGPPVNLAGLVEGGAVTLMWGPPDASDIAGYRVYRREEGTADRVLLSGSLVNTLSYRDERVPPGKKYEYAVFAVDTHQNISQAAITIVEVQ